jgi:hypothetical protein
LEEVPVMRTCERIAAGVFALVLCGSSLTARDLGRYRDFELGSGVAAVSALTGVAVSQVRILHHRPALIQELTWRPRPGSGRAAAPEAEALAQMVFAFYDDQLFRVTIDYDRERTKGLTDTDMVEAVSAIYGSRVTPTASERRQAPAYDEHGTSVARWGNADQSVVLYRASPYTASFRLVVTAEPIALRARTAAARALVLDAREAPLREAAREKQEAEDRRAEEEKARSTNRATFRP